MARKANTYEMRAVASGWQAVEFLDCDTDEAGVAMKETAERIVKWWAPTEKQAEKQLRGTA